MTQNVDKMNQFLKEWGQGIVEISSSEINGDNYQQVASDFIKKMYDYENGTVLFKPTKAAEVQFRNTFEGALSYFVGENKNFSEDGGFAISKWKQVDFEHHNIIEIDNTIFAMGNYYFTNIDNDRVKVEYSFGVKNYTGEYKIFLHHSSIPFSS